MISLKIVGVILIIISCYLYGEIAYEKLNSRLIGLKELHKVGRMLKANIRHTGSDIEEVLQDTVTRVRNEVQEFIKEVVQQIKTREVANISFIWNEAITNNFKNIRFSEEELIVIKRLGENLGYMDKEMQIENIELYLHELEEKIEILLFELRQKRKLYRTLSVSIGLFIVLIMV